MAPVWSSSGPEERWTGSLSSTSFESWSFMQGNLQQETRWGRGRGHVGKRQEGNALNRLTQQANSFDSELHQPPPHQWQRSIRGASASGPPWRSPVAATACQGVEQAQGHSPQQRRSTEVASAGPVRVAGLGVLSRAVQHGFETRASPPPFNEIKGC